MSTIRSSGRFIWIVAYLIIIFGIVTIYYRLPTYKYLIVLTLLFVQIIDIITGIKSIPAYLNNNNNNFLKKNDNEIWSIAKKNYKY